MEERKYQVYFVTTPIGNLDEMSNRSLSVLKSVDIIYCEDTKHSLRLLQSYEISKPLKSMHKFNFKKMLPTFLNDINQGKTIAYITDAGVPSISDPGQDLINALIENKIEYTLIGCPCAFVNALVLSGMNTEKFYFIGFLNEKQSVRKKQIEEITNCENTSIIYSSVHNIKKDLISLKEFLDGRKIAICRELTKMHEEVVFYTFGENELPFINQKGEFVVVIEGQKINVDNLDMETLLREELSNGENSKDAIKKIAQKLKLNKNDVYQKYLEIKDSL